MADLATSIGGPSHVDPAKAPDNAAVVMDEGGDGGVTAVVVAPTEGKTEAAQGEAKPDSLTTPKIGDKADADKAAAEPAAPTTVEEAVAKGVIDLEALATEYTKDGKLSDKTYEELTAKGYTKELVDTYIEGRKAQVKAHNDAIDASVGGAEARNALFQWAASNLTDAEKQAANAILASQNTEASKMLLAGLKVLYEAAVGKEPRLVQAATMAAPAAPQPYESTAEMLRDMRDPKYKTDPAFRAKVEQRLAMGM